MEEKYKTILESSYKPQKEFAEDIKKYNYDYDHELSSMDTKVFYNKETGQPNIVYRGSTRVSDWISNVNRALGNQDKSLDEALDVARKTQEKYGSNPMLFGHSRGGQTAEYVGNKLKGQVITYNKATMPQDIFKTIRPEQQDYRTSFDIVSLPSIFQKGGKKKTIKIPNPNIISSHGFKYL